jgi:hypothetical protein
MIHTTLGVYSNGSCKRNGVSSEFLEDHQNYNLKMRPGRAFVVDGKVIHSGGVSEETLKEVLAKESLLPKFERDTQPYV